MSDINKGLSVAVRAMDELPDEQKAVFRARYVAEEARDVTCNRLGIAPERYDQLLKDTLRSLRMMVAATPRLMANA